MSVIPFLVQLHSVVYHYHKVTVPFHQMVGGYDPPKVSLPSRPLMVSLYWKALEGR